MPGWISISLSNKKLNLDYCPSWIEYIFAICSLNVMILLFCKCKNGKWSALKEIETNDPISFFLIWNKKKKFILNAFRTIANAKHHPYTSSWMHCGPLACDLFAMLFGLCIRFVVSSKMQFNIRNVLKHCIKNEGKKEMKKKKIYITNNNLYNGHNTIIAVRCIQFCKSPNADTLPICSVFFVRFIGRNLEMHSIFVKPITHRRPDLATSQRLAILWSRGYGNFYGVRATEWAAWVPRCRVGARYNSNCVYWSKSKERRRTLHCY